jgi:uncharacterized integral membrane protein
MKARTIISIILIIFFLIFIYQNVQVITINFLVFHVSMSRSLILLVTFTIGLLVGIFIPFSFKQRK